MDAVKLLNTGRTVKAMEDRPSAYKVYASGRLPRFAPRGLTPFRQSPSTSQPAAQTTLFEAPQATTAEPAAEKAFARGPWRRTVGFCKDLVQRNAFARNEEAPTAVTAAVVEECKKEALPVVPVQPLQPVIPPSPLTQVATAAEKAHARGGIWTRTVRSCKRFVQRYVLGRKGRPIAGSTVQTELALEKVTVLRNDLNEDDLEVVLVERKEGTSEKPLARLTKMEMTAEAWSRLTAPFRKKSSESAGNPKAETKSSPELSAPV